MPKVVGTDRGGGDSRAQRTLQAVRTSMEVFLWKLESKIKGCAAGVEAMESIKYVRNATQRCP